MADIYLDNGKIGVSNGDIFICDDEIDVIQQAIHNIKTRVGENIFHPDIGNPSLDDRKKYLDSYADIIEDGCTTAIEFDDRIQSVDEISVKLMDGESYDYTIIFVVTTIFGDQLHSKVLI